jgi:hypothetical protein
LLCPSVFPLVFSLLCPSVFSPPSVFPLCSHSFSLCR